MAIAETSKKRDHFPACVLVLFSLGVLLVGCSAEMAEEPTTLEEQQEKTRVVIIPDSDPAPPEDNSSDDESEDDDGDRTVLVDQTGKEWDITHAVREYGMDPARFHFGLGPFAIPPILNPLMLTSGKPGFPPDDESFRVIGVVLSEEIRAYSIRKMSVVEVANEVFKEATVAVAY